jgi:hypothetical protein
MYGGSKQRGADARREDVGTNAQIPQNRDISAAIEQVNSWCVERDHGTADSLTRMTRRDQRCAQRVARTLRPGTLNSEVGSMKTLGVLLAAALMRRVRIRRAAAAAFERLDRSPASRARSANSSCVSPTRSRQERNRSPRDDA